MLRRGEAAQSPARERHASAMIERLAAFAANAANPTPTSTSTTEDPVPGANAGEAGRGCRRTWSRGQVVGVEATWSKRQVRRREMTRGSLRRELALRRIGGRREHAPIVGAAARSSFACPPHPGARRAPVEVGACCASASACELGATERLLAAWPGRCGRARARGAGAMARRRGAASLAGPCRRCSAGPRSATARGEARPDFGV